MALPMRAEPGPPGLNGRPSSGIGGVPWPDVAEMLTAFPGEWFVISLSHRSKGLASDITGGRVRNLRPFGRFEATSRTNDDKTYRIYARYLGPWDE